MGWYQRRVHGGHSLCKQQANKMKLVLIFAIAAIATAYETSQSEAREDIFQDMDQLQGEDTLRTAVTALRRVAPVELKSHVETISKHSELIQAPKKKAKAYAHNFAASKKAIMIAIKGLHGELNVGHRHDKAVLNKQRNLLNAAIKKSLAVGKATVNKYRNKACPTKRLEIEANTAKKSAKKKMEKHENGKVCPLGTRFRDMDIHKGTPNLGTELRSKWNRARTVYVRLQAVYNKAAAKHAAAVRRYNTAMSKFRTSVKLEATNAHNTCKNARGEYAVLVREVANNVNTRKQTFIATLVIKCYINNLTSNGGAKACADKAKKANTNRWNIVAGPLIPCNSKATNEKIFGPPGWKPSSKNCQLRHWHEALHKERTNKEKRAKERAAKERAAKERAKKAERRAKEKAAKAERRAKEQADKREKKSKELAKKEKAKKAAERRDKAARRERKAKADERRAKELSSKERTRKERNNKAERQSKERANKAREREAKRVAAERKTKERADKVRREKANKEQQVKERARKERNNKERVKKEQEREAKRRAQLERNGKESSAKRERAGKQERNNKAAVERNSKNTCHVKMYQHSHYRGAIELNRSICSPHRQDIRIRQYALGGRRRGYHGSSISLSSGCRQVQLWDEDACRYNYGHNQNIHRSLGGF